MGSKRSTGSSPGERKAKTGNDLTIPDQAKIQGKKADAFARKAVGLKNTDDGYISTAYDSATGKSFKSGNQMYGATYNEARGRYLESQGLAKARQVTDAMGKTRTVYDPRTADGTYTDLSRQAAEEARRNRTPLTKEMYTSQQKGKAGLSAVTALMGIPIIPGLLYSSSKQPYSNYLSNTENKGFYSESSSEGMMNKDRTGSTGTPIAFNEETEAQAERRKRMSAGSRKSDTAKGRSLFDTITQTFGGNL
jgi:hypothetical protein|tara:strand:+ start:2946 stop:3695 length:750 start_codon:yes stop_codon:yes gene_type:complete